MTLAWFHVATQEYGEFKDERQNVVFVECSVGENPKKVKKIPERKAPCRSRLKE
jgi:hypothetical protein